MNFTKKLMIMLSAALMVWSCSDDDEAADGALLGGSISLSAETIQADKAGGSYTVTVTSSDDWRLAGVCDWATPSATSGKSGAMVTFTIDPNTESETREVTYKFFTGSAVAPLKVESQPAYNMNLLTDAEMTVSRDAGVLSVQLNSNIAEPEITLSGEGSSWLTFERYVTFGDKLIATFNIAENAGYKDRSTEIAFSSPLTDATANVVLTQKQTDAVFVEEGNTQIYDLSERTVSLSVKYNVEYTIQIDKGEDWLTNTSVSDPVVGEDGLTTVVYTYHLDATESLRAGSIGLWSNDNAITNEIVLLQKSESDEVVQIPDANLRSYASGQGWILTLGGDNCVVLEAGKTATKYSGYSYIADVTGIENFPSLTSITMYANYSTYYGEVMTKFDISGLHNVSTLKLSSSRYVEEYNLGDNPITTFQPGNSGYFYSYAESIKVISSKLETLDMKIAYAYYGTIDKTTTLDLTECPALTTLDLTSHSNLKTVYLKQGHEIPNLTLPEGAEIVYK